jgi:hypothetical protein
MPRSKWPPDADKELAARAERERAAAERSAAYQLRREAKAIRDAERVTNETVYDDLGQMIFVPYFCRKGCDKGFPTRNARANHESWHGRVRADPPPAGTVESYYYRKNHKLPFIQEDRNAWNAYIREMRRRKAGKA